MKKHKQKRTNRNIFVCSFLFKNVFVCSFLFKNIFVCSFLDNPKHRLKNLFRGEFRVNSGSIRGQFGVERPDGRTTGRPYGRLAVNTAERPYSRYYGPYRPYSRLAWPTGCIQPYGRSNGRRNGRTAVVAAVRPQKKIFNHSNFLIGVWGYRKRPSTTHLTTNLITLG